MTHRAIQLIRLILILFFNFAGEFLGTAETENRGLFYATQLFVSGEITIGSDILLSTLNNA